MSYYEPLFPSRVQGQDTNETRRAPAVHAHERTYYARSTAVHIANEGQMSEVEALAILNVTERRPKWLLSQVHPDKHPDFSAEATAATARVNQAMDVRSRHVTEV